MILYLKDCFGIVPKNDPVTYSELQAYRNIFMVEHIVILRHTLVFKAIMTNSIGAHIKLRLKLNSWRIQVFFHEISSKTQILHFNSIKVG